MLIVKNWELGLLCYYIPQCWNTQPEMRHTNTTQNLPYYSLQLKNIKSLWKSSMYLKIERNNLDILKQWEGLLLFTIMQRAKSPHPKQNTLTSFAKLVLATVKHWKLLLKKPEEYQKLFKMLEKHPQFWQMVLQF